MTNYFYKLNRLSKTTLLSFGFLIVMLIMIPKMYSLGYYFKIFWIFVVMAMLAFNKTPKVQWLGWSICLVFIGYEISQNYFYVANHVFLLFYIALIGFVAMFYPYGSNKIIDFNAKMVLSLVLFFGGLQKIVASPFLEGDLMHFMFMRGELGNVLFSADFFQNYFIENKESMAEFRADLPSETTQIQMPLLIKNQHLLFYSFSIFVIVIELFLAILVWSNHQKTKLICFLLFLIGVMLTRLETGFISLLCLLLAVQIPVSNQFYKLWYIAIFVVCNVLIMLGLGLH